MLVKSEESANLPRALVCFSLCFSKLNSSELGLSVTLDSSFLSNGEDSF